MSKEINSVKLTGKAIAFMVAIAFTLLASTSTAVTKPNGRHFYVTFTYTDACGMLRVGTIGYTCSKGYPRTTDLILSAADASGASHKTVQITGITSICQADYKSLFDK